jgi:hypothetical protein
MRCASRKQSGERCKAAALRGQKRCHFHSAPGIAAAIGSVGGNRRRIFDAGNLRHFEPAHSPTELLEIIVTTLGDVREARLDAKTANSVASLATIGLALMRSTSLEERITKLEERDHHDR